MIIYLIRHGRQNSTKCNVNVPLSQAGKEQAILLGERLKQYEIDGVYSSDLIRAVETAEIIREVLGNSSLSVQIDSRLRESDFGDLEGIENDEVKKQYADFFEKRDLLEEDLPYPGGENGLDVYRRVREALLKITKQDKKRVCVVCHGGTIRSLLAGILNMHSAHRILFAKTLENCSITELFYDEKKDRFYVERVNDYAHLEGYPDLLRKNW